MFALIFVEVRHIVFECRWKVLEMNSNKFAVLNFGTHLLLLIPLLVICRCPLLKIEIYCIFTRVAVAFVLRPHLMKVPILRCFQKWLFHEFPWMVLQYTASMLELLTSLVLVYYEMPMRSAISGAAGSARRRRRNLRVQAVEDAHLQCYQSRPVLIFHYMLKHILSTSLTRQADATQRLTIRDEAIV